MDIETIEGMLGEHPFGISDAAIEEIMEAIKEYGDLREGAGFDDGFAVARLFPNS